MRCNCGNGKCLVLVISLNVYIHTYDSSASGKNPWRKLVSIVSQEGGKW